MEIKGPLRLDATVRVPGSKSYTQRALICAFLADGVSHLFDPLISEDTRYLMGALEAFGAEITVEDGAITVRGVGGRPRLGGGEVYLGNNGTAMRLLTGVACLGKGEITLTGAPRLLERPIRPLLDALKALGGICRPLGKGGFPPVAISSGGLRGGKIILRDIESSQYISALLISAPYANGDTIIELEGEVPSLPYVEVTCEVMRGFGVDVRGEARCYFVQGGQRYLPQSYQIEGDCSSASYFFLAAALCKGRVRVYPIPRGTVQGDIGFLSILEELGCRVERGDDWVEVVGGGLAGGDYTFDLGDMPDLVPTLAVLAAVRHGTTTITNCAHLRHKESDRLAAIVAELKKLGVQAGETADGVWVKGGRPQGAEIETYNDHRIAMAFAILGLVVPGIRIKDKGCVAKSFPGFWSVLEGICGSS